MAKRKMKQLALAVGTALGSLALLPSAQAVNLATDGLGQVLIFPYYTTRANWSTLINITNTSDQVVAAKVRFHEAYNSRDVLDFTLILSPKDVWTGWVENGAGNVPYLRTNDNSCTVPAIPVAGQPFGGINNGVPFGGMLAYTGIAADGGPVDTERLREGYVKVLMNGAADISPNALAAGAIHTAAGVPANCAALRTAFSTTNGVGTVRAAFPNYNEDINPLKGSYNLVNGLAGLTAGGNAVVLADFYRTSLAPGGVNQLATLQLPPLQAGSLVASFHEPNLHSANTVGQVLTADGILNDNTLTDSPPIGANAVNYVLRRSSVYNQWTRRTNAAEGWVTSSDWVVTFPTKRYYADTAGNEFAGRARDRQGLPNVFTLPYFASPFIARSCDPVTYRIFDREEVEFRRDQGPVFSPAPTPEGNAICYEANILTFAGSNVLGSAPTLTANIPELPGNNGWMQLDFAVGQPKPAIGFSITTRITGDSAFSEAFLVDHASTSGR